MSKIKDVKSAKELFGYNASFAVTPTSSENYSSETGGLTGKDLADEIEDAETREALKALQDQRQARAQSGRGRPRKTEESQFVTMSFRVDKEQLAQLREIAYRKRVLIKDLVSQAFGDLIDSYEKKNGKLKP